MEEQPTKSRINEVIRVEELDDAAKVNQRLQENWILLGTFTHTALGGKQTFFYSLGELPS